MKTRDIATAELLTDAEAEAVLGVGHTNFTAMQKLPDFPVPIWLSPRGKRHDREELLAWARGRRARPATQSTFKAGREAADQSAV